MKIVIDTNVLINGFKDDYSTEKKIIDAVVRGEVEAFANRQTLQENRLITSQLIDNNEYRRELDELFLKIHWVQNKHLIHVVRDPEDNKILESAVEANADYLVTDDNDLLRLENYENVTIVNPTKFWSEYKDEGADLWNQWTSFINGQKDRQP